jgi:alpha-2-macroglobulin
MMLKNPYNIIPPEMAMTRKLIILLILLAITAASAGCGRQIAGEPESTTAGTSTPGSQEALAPLAQQVETPPSGDAPTAPGLPSPRSPSVDVREISSDLDTFPPNASFSVQFEQPIDPLSADPPLLTYPWVEGSHTWNSDFTSLIFTPVSGFEPERQYILLLNQELRTSRGETPGPEREWRLRTLAAPRLVSRTPGANQLTDRTPEITLFFDQPMDQASLKAALTVQPQSDFALDWEAPDTVIIKMLNSLSPGQRYHFNLSTDAKDRRGVNLAKDLRWDYYLPDWIAGLSGPTFSRENAPIQISFSYAVDTGSIEQALQIDPPLAFDFDWKNNKDLVLAADVPLPRGITYTINFISEILDESGDTLPPLDPLIMHTPPPILAISPPPGETEASPDRFIQIKFDRLMDQEKTQAAFNISPPVFGEFSWDESALTFIPNPILADFTKYSITLDIEAAGIDGEPILNEPFSWSITTSMLNTTTSPRASFGDYGPNAQVLDLRERRAVQFLASARTEVVDFSLHRMNMEQFLDRYSSGFRGVAGNEKIPISLEGTTLSARWSVDTRVTGAGWGANIYETLLPGDVPAGFYILDMSINDLSQERLLVALSQYALVVKDANGEITVWTSAINGGSVPNMDVSIYARDGSLLASGRSNSNGFYKTTVSGNPEPLIVIAGFGNDLTISGLSREWMGRGGYWWGWWFTPEHLPVNYRAYLYTERPLYQPGHTVYFKAFVRSDNDGEYSMPPEGLPVTIRIRDERDNVVQTFDLVTNDQGSVHGDFLLGDGAMVGDYNLEAEIGGERFRQVFKVQEYRKPDYEVNLSSDSPHYVAGDNVQVTLRAAYYFGEPVANARIIINRFYLEPFYNWSLFQDQEAGYNWHMADTGVIRGTTDENGIFTFSFPAELQPSLWYFDESESARTSSWGIEATLDDGSRQTVSGFTVLNVSNSSHKLSLDTGDYFKRPGEPFTVRSRIVDLDDRPVTGSNLLLELRRWNASSWSYTTVVQSERMASGSDGRAAVSFTIEQPGYYQMRLSGVDDRGNPISTSNWVYAFQRGDSFFYGQNEFRIGTDKTSYLPGETAMLIIETVQSGPALLTFERGRVHREQTITLTPPLTTVPVVVEASDAPNIFISVHTWETQDTHLEEEMYSSKADSRLLSSSTELKVQVMGKSLTVEILPDRSIYSPRDEANITVKVTSEDGRPVQAEVSLALVDEALFALKDDLAKPIFEAFYSPRANRVNTYNSMALTRELYLGGMGGGGDDTGFSGPRSDFRDTAAWYPALLTDANGEASIRVALPDNLTNWRITARAVSALTQVGEATANIVTHQEVVVRPFLPHSLTVGDKVALSAAVHNYASEPRNLNLTLSSASPGDEALRLDEPLTHTASLEPGEMRIFTWQAEALASGEAWVTLRAASPEGLSGDSIRLPLNIRRFAVPEYSSQVSYFEDSFFNTLYLPAEALPSSYLEIEISRSVTGALLDGLEYLTGYPYGCVEQTMSRALPNAVVARAFRQLGIENPTLEADLPPMINAGLQRLYGYQHNDGGWGWWYDDKSDAYQTAWVIFGLATTLDAGYEVDPQVIQRGVSWLATNLNSMDIRIRAYALYSLAAAGHTDRDAALELAKQAYRLDTFSLSALALALHGMGENTEAQRLLYLIEESAVIVNGGMAFWPQPLSNLDYDRHTMSSTIRTSAIALNALVHIDPNHELVPAAASWLMGQRRQQGWGHTNETAYTIIALSDYMLSTISGEPESVVTVSLNGMSKDTLRLQGHPAGSGAFARLTLTREQLQSGINLISLTQSGAGRLFVTTRSRIDMPYSDAPAAGSVALKREYLDWESNERAETAEPGKLVRVRLTLDTDQPISFAILEDHLPGGLEALNESLNTTSRVTDIHNNDVFHWRSLGYNNKEVRSDRVTFFITEVNAGTYSIEYLARAVSSGTFIALPAEAYAMYESSIWGRSESSILTVGE